MNSWYDYTSERARLARLSATLSGWVRYLFIGLFFGLFLVGAWLVYNREPLGWLPASFSLWPLLPLLWNERYLKNLPVGSGQRLDERIESPLLARLPARLTPQILGEHLVGCQSVHFMMARAGISPQLVGDMNDPQVIKQAWDYALARYPEGIVSAAALFAGLIKTDDKLKAVLPHLQLDQNDVDLVVDWYDHLNRLIVQHKQPRFTGGIGRDWSFGYTPLLSRFGANISEQVMRGGNMRVDIETHQEALNFLVETFGSGGKQNAALVGPTGAGKTSLIRAFAEMLMQSDSPLPANLKFHQVISLDAAALISAASGRGQLEELLNALLVEAYKARNIILCLDDAELFFEQGVGSVDVSKLLQPVLDGGVLRVIMTMDAQRYLQITKRNPALGQSLNRFTLSPADYHETIRVMQDQLIVIEFQKKVTYMYQALREAYRLSERYLYDVAQPGKALQLLASASQYAENDLVTAASVQRAIEQTEGVKVGANVSGDDKARLLNLESLIHERMINQTRAVSVVSDALRRARAGVRNEQRPIGTFMFLGPTGVGKTELAKSLAHVYFGGEDRLIRLDMNEFVEPSDVKRLIADGADDPHSLSAQVIKQPFAVILLDEIEKAHDSVLTTLLQVLDEGILRDIRGREVSFRDAIIIATSNAGAEHIRASIEAGEELEQIEPIFVDGLIRSGEFRSEFLNRFDEIVLFRPLKPEELLQVVDLIIAGINKTLEPQKVSVHISQELKEWLVAKGNDPRLGARPMRRIVQRTVESTVAKRLLAGDVQPGQTVILTPDDVPPELQTVKN